MLSKKILIESRISDFERVFDRKFSGEQKEKILNEIPSKFYQWTGKNLDQISFDENFELVKNLLSYFNRFGSNLKKTDINQYTGIDELKRVLDEYSERQRRNFKKQNGANVVYETPKYLVINPLSHESSCYYGSGTKWCTTGRDTADTFNRYNSDGKLFYIIDKTLPSSDPNYKIALSKKFGGEEDFYDALDNSLKVSQIVKTEDFKKILKSINEYMGVEYAAQLKIYSDEREKKKEQERLRNLEAQRIKNAKLAEADERRTEGEWDLTNEIDDIGLKAWALFQYLEGEGADVKTKEDIERAREITLEIERLNSEYDNSEDVRTDLLDEISDLEDELETINDKMDVYMIIPETYDHYEMTRFEVIGDDFYGQTFAVGDDQEVEDSAVEYVEGLIDDIGYEGFNSGFWKSHIDEDAVIGYAEEMYNDDLYDNPDSYLNDEDRMLDSHQLDQIRNLKSKINSLVINQTQLKEVLDELDDSDPKYESIEEKIESIEEMMEELRDEITDIEDDPQGDFPQDVIDEKLQELLSDVRRDPESFMETYGLNTEDYIDKDSFVQSVIDADGYGMLSSYDGAYEVVKVRGTDYYVMRID
jgi:hypothetical protein